MHRLLVLPPHVAHPFCRSTSMPCSKSKRVEFAWRNKNRNKRVEYYVRCDIMEQVQYSLPVHGPFRRDEVKRGNALCLLPSPSLTSSPSSLLRRSQGRSTYLFVRGGLLLDLEVCIWCGDIENIINLWIGSTLTKRLTKRSAPACQWKKRSSMNQISMPDNIMQIRERWG
jgi:hypothetical protein